MAIEWERLTSVQHYTIHSYSCIKDGYIIENSYITKRSSNVFITKVSIRFTDGEIVEKNLFNQSKLNPIITEYYNTIEKAQAGHEALVEKYLNKSKPSYLSYKSSRVPDWLILFLFIVLIMSLIMDAVHFYRA